MLSMRRATFTTRVLVVDDNPDIFGDIRKILAPPGTDPELDALDAELFGGGGAPTDASGATEQFELDYAEQGEHGVALVEASLAQRRPYAVAFVDVRIPPGQNGVVTMERMLAIDHDLHVVLCTAYADFSWAQMLKRCPARDRLLILKKPFDAIEVAQLAHALSRRWRLARATSAAYEIARAISGVEAGLVDPPTRAVATPEEWGAVLAEIADRAAHVHARLAGGAAEAAIRAIGAAFSRAVSTRARAVAG